MDSEDGSERDDADPNRSPGRRRPRGFRLELGIHLTDLLGSAIGVNAREPLPSESPADRSNVDEYTVYRHTEGELRPGRSSRNRERDSAAERCRIDTRFGDDELVVVADLGRTNEDDLSVGIDLKRNDLVIGRDGSIVGRVTLPYTSPEATRARFNNGVLEVRLRPGEA